VSTVEELIQAWKEDKLPDFLLEKAGVPRFRQWWEERQPARLTERAESITKTPEFLSTYERTLGKQYRPWEVEALERSQAQSKAESERRAAELRAVPRIAKERAIEFAQNIAKPKSAVDVLTGMVIPGGRTGIEAIRQASEGWAEAVAPEIFRQVEPREPQQSYEDWIKEETVAALPFKNPFTGKQAKVGPDIMEWLTPDIIFPVGKAGKLGKLTPKLEKWAVAQFEKEGTRVAQQVFEEIAKHVPKDEALRFVDSLAQKARAAQRTELDIAELMWKEGRKKAPKDIPGGLLKLQEYINDSNYGLRRMLTSTERATGNKVQTGSNVDIVTLLDRSPGVANAGATRYILTIEETRRAAPNVTPDDINTILYANHAKEVLAEKGARRVMAGGFTDIAQLDNMLLQLRAKMGDEMFENAQRGAEVIRRVYAQELERLTREGLIKREVADLLSQKYPWYNPLRYIDDEAELAKQGKSVVPYSVISSGLKRLSERGTEKWAKAPLDVLADQLIRNEVRIHKNQVARAIVTLAIAQPDSAVTKVNIVRPVAQVEDELIFRPFGGDIPGTISFFENGARQVYNVPEWIYREAEVLSKSISNPVSSLVGSLNGISRAAFTTFSPSFVVANMLNDALTAFIRGGILPHDTGLRLIKNLQSIHTNKVMQAFRLAGGYQARFYGDDLAKQVIKDGGQALGQRGNFLKKIARFIPAAGEAGEQAPRMARFEKTLNKTLPGWKKMSAEQIAATPQGRAAAAEAVELTINFGRGGYLIKAANPFVIFLNASMEGVKLPFRTLRNKPSSALRLAGVGAGIMGLTGYNLSYPEYFDIPHEIRWGSVVIMLPSKGKDKYGQQKPNYVAIIPRTREWGLFFGPMTYAMEKLFADSPTDFGTFASVMAPMISPIAEVPSPQVIAVLTEQIANWDFYRSQPIVPAWKKELPPEEQTAEWVSPTIQKVANFAHLSPLRLQHAVTGLFGGAGATALSIPDFIDNMIAGREQKGIPIISSVIRRVYPERGGQLYRTEQEVKRKKSAAERSNPYKPPASGGGNKNPYKP